MRANGKVPPGRRGRGGKRQNAYATPSKNYTRNEQLSIYRRAETHQKSLNSHQANIELLEGLGLDTNPESLTAIIEDAKMEREVIPSFFDDANVDGLAIPTSEIHPEIPKAQIISTNPASNAHPTSPPPFPSKNF